MKPRRTIWPALFSIIFCACLFILSASATFAIIGIDQPIIPCGNDIVNETVNGVIKTVVKNPCNFCHIFELVHNIYNFLMFVIVPPVAVLMVAVAGFLWLSSGVRPSWSSTAKRMLLTIGIGLLMMYVAWLLVSFGIRLVARNIGAYNPAVWYQPNSWFTLECGEKTNILWQCSTNPCMSGNRITDCTLYDSQDTCAHECTNGTCSEYVPADQGAASGVTLDLSSSQINMDGFTVASWTIGKDDKGNDIDLTSCSATVSQGAKANDVPLTNDIFTQKVRASRSGSLTVGPFDHTGGYTFEINCAKGSAQKILNVTKPDECHPDDLFTQWTDASGNTITTSPVPLTVYGELQYNTQRCKGAQAVILIKDQSGTQLSSTNVALNDSGKLRVPLTPTGSLCGASGGDKLFLEVYVQNISGSNMRNTPDQLQLTCPANGG